MKAGGTLDLLVWNPLINDERVTSAAYAEEDLEKATDIAVADLLRPFRSARSIEATRKEQNTAEFLDAAKAHSLRHFPEYAAQLREEASEGSSGNGDET